MMLRGPALGLLLSALVGTVFAQEPELAFTEVLRLALANSPSVQAKARELDAADSTLKGAEWGRYPALSAQLASLPAGVDTNLAASQSAPSSYLRLDQPLYAWGAIDARIKTADLQKTVAKLAISSEMNSVADRVIGAFGQIVAAQAKITVQQDAVARLTEFEGIIGRRLASLLSSKNDASLVNSRLQQARSEVVQSYAAETRALAQLEEVIGQSVKGKMQPLEVAVDWANLDALQLSCLDSASELASVRVGRDLAENQVKQRTADLFPRLVGRLERIHAPTVGLSSTDYTQAYVVLEASLGNGLSALEGVNESSARLQASEQQIEVTRRALLQQTASAWSEFRSFSDQESILKEITSENQEIVESFIRQYLAGKKRWLEVLNVERELVQSRLQMADIRATLMTSALRLQRLGGHLNLAPGSKAP